LTAHFAAAEPSGRRVAPLPLAGRRLPAGGVHFTASADLGAAAPHLTVRRGARVVRLERRGARGTAVRVATGGGEERLAAEAFVVAAGPFATPRLLHASGIRPRALGRWLHYHPLLLGQLVLEEELSAPAAADDPPPRLWIPPTRAAPWHGMVLRDVGAGAPQEPADERRLIELQFFAPVEPREEHHMSLDGPRPRFAVELTPADRATMEAMHADVLAIGAALGRWRQGCEPSFNPWGFSHPMGSTRMGDDPTTSVVDRHGRVHGFENLYLAGVGLVPVAIAVNPTLTAVALGLAAADHIAGDA
jgi:choline dehydrogenase-like flavoprotein